MDIYKSLIVCFLSSLLQALVTCDCGLKVQKLGCYEDKTSDSVALLNDRNNIDWKNIAEYSESLACKCAALAKELGFPGFGLEYYGECYAKTQEEIDALTKGADAKKHLCVGDQTYTVCEESHDFCVGKDNAQAVYVFGKDEEPSIDGGLSEWNAWTKCDKACGPGFRHRERNCNNPVPSGKGKDCSGLGPLLENQACKIKDCPPVVNPCSSHSSSMGKYSRKWSSLYVFALSKIPVKCLDNNKILTNFQMEHRTASRTIRYRYGCCKVETGTCTKKPTRYTQARKISSGLANSVLALHSVDCGVQGLICGFALQRLLKPKRIRYRYNCCDVNTNPSCYSGHTEYKGRGKRGFANLKYQNVQCKAGYGLSKIKVQNGANGTWRYNFRCCKIK